MMKRKRRRRTTKNNSVGSWILTSCNPTRVISDLRTIISAFMVPTAGNGSRRHASNETNQTLFRLLDLGSNAVDGTRFDSFPLRL